MLMSMVYLDQILPVSSTVEALEVTLRVSMWSWFASCVSVSHAYFLCTCIHVFMYTHELTCMHVYVGSP